MLKTQLFFIVIFTFLNLFNFSICKAQNSYSQSKIFNDLEPIKINLSNIEDQQTFVNIKAEHSKHGTLIDKKKIQIDKARKTAITAQRVSNKSAKKAFEPKVVNSFEGNFSSGGTPTDNNLAISNSGIIITAINSNIRIMNEDGETLMAKTLSSLAKSVGNLSSAYDPHVSYDAENDRFILIFLSGYSSVNSNLIVGFTASNDPTEDWNFYKLPGTVHGNDTWSDYPFLAISKEEVFIPVLLWLNGESGWDSEAEEIIWQIEKKAGYEGGKLTYKYYDKVKIGNKKVWNTRPVAGSMKAYGPNMYFVGNRAIDEQNDSIFVFEITNTLASGKAELKVKVAKSNVPYGIPPSALQPLADDPLRTNYADIHSAYLHYGKIHFVGNSMAKSTNSPGIYYGIISDLDSENPSVDAQIFSLDTLDLNYPSMAYAGGDGIDRSFIINCLHSSANTNPGTSVLYVDRDGKFSDLIRVKSGESPINVMGSSSIERWGDYTGCQRQYNKSGVVWLAGSFGKNNRNATWVAKVESTDSRLSVSSINKDNLLLYPNPSYSLVNIVLDVVENSMYSIDIFDIKGKLIKNLSNEYLNKGSLKFQFDISNLKKGTYILKCINTNGVRIEKQFVVQ